MPTIYIIKGPNNGGIFTLTEDDCVIGRSDKCSIKLDDDRVSGSHLTISYDSDQSVHVAEDIRSTNGSWLNGRSLTAPAHLKDGDKIELGATLLEFTSMSFDSIEAAKAARQETSYTAAPTMMEEHNRKF